MLNHTYTSVKHANLVDCGKKQHIPSQPSPLLKDNFLGEFRTELDKKKVLANLGIVTDISLEWEYIKGDIGKSDSLMQELDSRTKYISEIDGFQKSVIEGIQYLETIIGGELDLEEEQNNRILELEDLFQGLSKELDQVKSTLTTTIEVDIEQLKLNLENITDKVNNITNLVQVSSKPNNALVHITEGTPGLYVPDLSEEIATSTENIKTLRSEVNSILETYVTKDELGGGDFNFVNQDDFDAYTYVTDEEISDIKEDLKNTVKTGEDGHVDTLYVNKISKNNDDSNIKITDSFEPESGIPLDVRFVVKSLEELHSLKPIVCYAGMGVIVSDQASLYILREPANGVIDEAYIKDEKGINWKCPEDLVIEVLTQDEYDKKVEEGSINPNMFYYIHEEVTEEPTLEDFNGDEEAYKIALDKWLRVLQQKYMSAVWGQEIEELVASKASNTAIKSLETEIQRLSALIDSLSGGSSNVNLKGLNEQVSTNTANIETLIKEDGTIPTIQKDLSNLQNAITSEYVTKAEITSENPEVEYIFVKKTAFETYKQEHAQQIAEEVVTDKVTTAEVILSDDVLTSNENDLLFNNEKVALDKQVPVIEVIDNASYEALPEKDPKKYYYVYDDEERYVLDSEFSEYKAYQSGTISMLSESINKNKTEIGDLSVLSTESKNTLVYAINELSTKIIAMLAELEDLKNRVSNLENVE